MDEWLELATTVEPEAVESVSAVFAEYGQGVAIEQVVESSRDGDVVNLPADAPVLIKTYLPLPIRRLTNGGRRSKKASGRWASCAQVGSAAGAHAARGRLGERLERVLLRAPRRPADRSSCRAGAKADYEPQPDDVVLLLDPGMAFGTGLHPTTRLCLQRRRRVRAAGHARAGRRRWLRHSVDRRGASSARLTWMPSRSSRWPPTCAARTSSATA